MTPLEITLIVILYILIAFFIGIKQRQAIGDKYDDVYIPLGMFWPITLIVYIVKKTVIEDWK